MESVRELIQILVRRFRLVIASSCERCCGEGVSLVQGNILFEIGRRENPAMQQVAEALGMDITTFSRQIKTLENKGLVKKSPDPDDRRVNILALTSEGKKAIDQIDLHMNQYLEQLFSSLTAFEQEAVIKAIKLLNKALLKSVSVVLKDNFSAKYLKKISKSGLP